MKTVPEAAKELGVDPKTIRNHIHAGRIAATRTGPGSKSHLRITDEAWAEFLRTCAVEVPAA